MSSINQNAGTPALIIDDKGKFINIMTDGDIRRAILRGINLDNPITEVLEHKFIVEGHKPITRPQNTKPQNLLATMKEFGIRHIPLLDQNEQVVELASQDDLESPSCNLKAVIMAGGLGNRLRPLTKEMPKPMLPVGGKPLLETIVNQLSEQGITEIFISTFYKAEIIINHFGDGSNFGVRIHYLIEDTLTGTAGALSHLPKMVTPTLVINGDIITTVNFELMSNFHLEHGADMTIGSWQHQVNIEYGVIETEGYNVKSLTEKPTIGFLINSGMYVLSPKCLQLVPDQIPEEQVYHMTDLIQSAIDHKYTVISFPIHEHWSDIGRLEDYEKAQSSPLNSKENER